LNDSPQDVKIKIPCKIFDFIATFWFFIFFSNFISGTKHGKLIALQLLDVTIRVESIREFSVHQMAILIDNMHLFGTGMNSGNSIVTTLTAFNSNLNEVFYAASWICGEFGQQLKDPVHTMNSMLKAKVTQLPGHIQASFVQNVFKLYSMNLNRLLESTEAVDLDLVQTLTSSLLEKMTIYEQSGDLEVQERACTFIQMLKYIQRVLDKRNGDLIRVLSNEVKVLFEGDLNPVAPKAQRKVPIPDGLDLDEWINEPPSESENDEINENQIFVKNETYSGTNNRSTMNYSLSSKDFKNNMNSNEYFASSSSDKAVAKPDDDSSYQRREARKLEMELNPYYIKPSSKKVISYFQCQSNVFLI
jgi:AP-3 complex subunit delta-1